MGILEKINSDWTLFLDRDGVINVRYVDDYVKKVEDFIFTENAEKAIAQLSRLFKRTVVVTNQQGIGKGVMSAEELTAIHAKMREDVLKAGGKIDAVYYCPDLKHKAGFCRKPNGGMALRARKDFPEIRFKQSLMVGDTLTDMLFGKRLGMRTVLIGGDAEALRSGEFVDACFASLSDFADYMSLKGREDE